MFLLAFSFAPSSKANWDGKGRPGDKDVDAMVRRVDSLMKEGLTPEDLTLCWLSRRVRPLQNRVHKMCVMSGRLDPTGLTTKNYSTSAQIGRAHV